jgi:hypothetical protein
MGALVAAKAVVRAQLSKNNAEIVEFAIGKTMNSLKFAEIRQ